MPNSEKTAIIVDDEQMNRDALAKLVDQFCTGIRIVAKASSAAEAREMIERHRPHLLFLDIEMPDGDGFSLLNHYETPDFQVIFTTAHAEYAIKAIKFAALDYLLKPINITELRTAVARALNNIDTKANTQISGKLSVFKSNKQNDKFNFQKIALPTFDGLEFYPIAEILKCEADRAYCNFYITNNKQITVSKPLSEFEDLLSECNFMRVHKSYMVNMDHIKKYVKGKGGYVVLTDGSHVDVASRRKEELLKVLSAGIQVSTDMVQEDEEDGD